MSGKSNTRMIPSKTFNEILLTILILFSFSCANQSKNNTNPPRKTKNLNVVIITVDTLRNDYLNASGNHKVYTPNINKLAKEGVQFFNSRCQIPYTIPSLSSLFTSLPPRVHGVLSNNHSLPDTPHILTKVLKKHNYYTQGIISGLANPSTGLNQGFDGYKDNTSGNRRAFFKEAKPIVSPKKKSVSSDTIPDKDKIFINAERCAENACEWLDNNYNKKFFLWVHFWEPHQPYIPPEEQIKIYEKNYEGKTYQYFHQFEKIRREKILLPLSALEHVKNLYKAEITYTDSQIGKLIKKIKSLNILDKTLIVFTADHGEEMYEHKYFIGHGRYLYEPAMRTPLIFYHKDLPSSDFNQMTESIDISPTILSYLNIPVPKEMMGRNLLDLIFKKNFTGKTYYFGETEQVRFSISTGTWKLLYEKRRKPELYNILTDPGERRELFGSKTQIARKLQQNLLNWIKENSKKPPLTKTNEDPDMLKKLKALGYIN